MCLSLFADYVALRDVMSNKDSAVLQASDIRGDYISSFRFEGNVYYYLLMVSIGKQFE